MIDVESCSLNMRYMFWRGHLLSERLITTLGLFTIGSLHAMIFAVFQIPENFLLDRNSPELAFYCKIVLYSFAIGASLSHQLLCRKIGLRKTLYVGLLCNLLGLATLMLNKLSGGSLFLIFLDMIFFGIALTSVINALVTYIILEFPKKIGTGITAFFACLNGGVLLAPFLLNVFLHRETLFYFLLMGLILLSLWYVHVTFFEPPFPAHLAHLRQGTLIWKELHYRLGLFVTAIVCYGLTETTFNLWGFIQIDNVLGTLIANETIPIFWLFLIIGQILLLIPLYFFPAKRIFYLLILTVFAAGIYFSHQTHLAGFISGLALAGFGCSAVFPILLSMMEKEILSFAEPSQLLPFIETVVSVMLAGYFFGVGIIDLWVQKWGAHPVFALPTHFFLASLFIGITGILAIYLNWTVPKR